MGLSVKPFFWPKSKAWLGHLAKQRPQPLHKPVKTVHSPFFTLVVFGEKPLAFFVVALLRLWRSFVDRRLLATDELKLFIFKFFTEFFSQTFPKGFFFDQLGQGQNLL